ncbi:PepSY domain-containing protein [Altererythrobacter sp. CAU 1778]
MKRILASLAGAAMLAGTFAAPAAAQSRSDQDEARKEMKAGNTLSLRQIERQVLPRMRGMEYLGPEYDSAARAYRLKFIEKGKVVFVDVDARSGKVLRRSR